MPQKSELSVLLYLKNPPARGGYYYGIPVCIVSASGTLYEIGNRIGAGGNAVVHECVASTGKLDGAIKVQLNLKDSRPQRFKRECRLLRAVDHPNLVKCYDDGIIEAIGYKSRWDGGRRIPEATGTYSLPFVVMERAESTLDTLLQERPSLRPEYYIAQFRGLVDALSVLHAHAVHRDIKPSNILISSDRWLLGDFGLCRFIEGDVALTVANEMIGPRSWMSPEAANRAQGGQDEITCASDVHQLAQVFWFVVTGERVENEPTRDQWTGPERLYDPIATALSDNPAVRPQNGTEFAGAIERTLES